MINKELEELIKKYKITNTKNIIYGTNIPMPNKVLITPNKTHISFETTEKYFFYFDEQGITNHVHLSWEEITDFKMTHISILGKMTITTKNDIYKFQINRMVIGCPWIKENRKYLESKNYFYKRK